MAWRGKQRNEYALGDFRDDLTHSIDVVSGRSVGNRSLTAQYFARCNAHHYRF